MDLSKKTTIRTNLGFLAIIAVLLVTGATSFLTLQNSANTNKVHITTLQEDVRTLKDGDTTTRIQLAEIQVTLKSIETTLEELKAK